MSELLHELHYSLRQLAKNPLFFLAAALTLGLGIGVNTTVFSSMNGWLMRPMPVSHPQNLVMLAERDNISDFAQGPSYPDYLDYKKMAVFSDAAVTRLAVTNFHRTTVSDRLWVEAVSGNYFSMLGLAAAQGTLFGVDEERSPVIVLSYATWAGRFGADPAVIGSTVRLNAQTFTVVGVTPREYHGAISYVESEGFVPLKAAALRLNTESRTERGYRMLARLANGVRLEQAQAAVAVTGAALSREYPAADRDVRPMLVTEIDSRPEPSVHRMVARMMMAGLALVGFVLLIASANLANLLLVRAAKRKREFAIRAALGASRGRIVRLIFLESLLIGFAGLATGIILSSWMRGYLAGYQPAVDFRYRQDYTFDWRVLAFGIAVTLLTSLLCGAFPAWRIGRSDLNEVIKDSGAARASAKQIVASVLVVAEVAACALLLICTGLFIRGLAQASNMDMGFDTRDRVVFSFNLDRQGYTAESAQRFIKTLVDRVSARPGVRAAAFVNWLPFNGFSTERVYTESEIPDNEHGGKTAMWSVVSPQYFAAIGDKLVSGRVFSERDDAKSAPVAVVNRAFAEKVWPGQDAIGKRFRTGPGNALLQVVGVAETGKYVQLDEPPQPWYYVPFAQRPLEGGALVVNSSMPASITVEEIRSEFRTLDPELPVYGVMTLKHLVDNSYVFGPPRVGTGMAVAFSMVGLLLAGVGLYGVIANSVAQRTKEIGIRLGLGADRGMIIRFVLRQGVALIAFGLAIGIAGAFAVGGMIHRFVFGVNARDPLTFGAVIGLVLLTGVAACYWPSRTAADIDPAIALRAE